MRSLSVRQINSSAVFGQHNPVYDNARSCTYNFDPIHVCRGCTRHLTFSFAHPYQTIDKILDSDETNCPIIPYNHFHCLWRLFVTTQHVYPGLRWRCVALNPSSIACIKNCCPPFVNHNSTDIPEIYLELFSNLIRDTLSGYIFSSSILKRSYLEQNIFKATSKIVYAVKSRFHFRH